MNDLRKNFTFFYLYQQNKTNLKSPALTDVVIAKTENISENSGKNDRPCLSWSFLKV